MRTALALLSSALALYAECRPTFNIWSRTYDCISAPSTSTYGTIVTVTATADGTTDAAASIQASIDAAAALGRTGTVVDFGDSSKTYAIGTRLTLKPNLTYRCDGATIKTLSSASAGTQIAASIYGASDNILITGCVFDANTKGGALLFNVDGGGALQANNISIVNNTIKNTKASPAGGYDGAIYSTSGIQNVLIQNNKILNCPSGIELKNPNYATVDGNQFDTINTADAMSYTFDGVGSFQRGKGLKFTNNRARKLTRMMVEVWSNTTLNPLPESVLVADNLATDWVVDGGIQAFGMSIMTGANVSIVRNTLYGGLGTGYCIESGTDGATIEGNTCVGFHDGIGIHQGVGTKVLHNRLYEQTLTGIRLTNTDPKTSMVIDGNEIRDAKEFAIWAETGTWGGTVIKNNNIRRGSGFWSDDGSKLAHGITMTGPNTPVTIDNNYIEQYAPNYVSGWAMIALRFNGVMGASTINHNTFVNRTFSGVCPCDGILINTNGDADSTIITNNVFVNLNNASNGGSSTPGTKTGNVIVSCSNNGPIFP